MIGENQVVLICKKLSTKKANYNAIILQYLGAKSSEFQPLEISNTLFICRFNLKNQLWKRIMTMATPGMAAAKSLCS